jgi:hypothetical protein
MEKKEIRLTKIPLGTFLDALLELYNEGLDYIDIIGTPDEKQDTIGIAFTREYMSKSMAEKYNDLEAEFRSEFIEENDEPKDIDLSDEDDLNQII